MECRASTPVASVATVLENRQVGATCYEMRLANEYVARRAAPGQFVHVRVPSPSLDPLLRRPFSVCMAEPASGAFLILYQIVGRGTMMLSALRPGDSLDVLGPLGRGFEAPGLGCAGNGGSHSDGSSSNRGGSGRSNGAEKSVLVAGGLGIAPLVMLSHALVGTGVGFSLVVGARSGELLAGLDLLPQVHGGRALSSGHPAAPETVQGALVPERSGGPGGDDGPECEIQVVTEDGSAGRRGLVTDALRDLLVRGRVACVYACGPAGMLREVARLGEAFCVPVQVSLEERMACGLGACLGCAVRARGDASGERPAYLRVCTDGPVFWAKEVDLDAIAET